MIVVRANFLPRDVYKRQEPVLEPVLTYQVLLPEGCDVSEMLRNLRQLEEEDPLLRVVWKEELSEIHVCLMGEVQIQIPVSYTHLGRNQELALSAAIGLDGMDGVAPVSYTHLDVYKRQRGYR